MNFLIISDFVTVVQLRNVVWHRLFVLIFKVVLIYSVPAGGRMSRQRPLMAAHGPDGDDVIPATFEGQRSDLQSAGVGVILLHK